MSERKQARIDLLRSRGWIIVSTDASGLVTHPDYPGKAFTIWYAAHLDTKP